MDKLKVYQIRVEGKLDPSWSEWFSDMEVVLEYDHNGSPITTITGPVVDQPALRGILSKVWDLHVILLSVVLLDPPGGA
jgi:hypothetical protein